MLREITDVPLSSQEQWRVSGRDQSELAGGRCARLSRNENALAHRIGGSAKENFECVLPSRRDVYSRRGIEHAAECNAIVADGICAVGLIGGMIVPRMDDRAQRKRQCQQRNYFAQQARRSAGKGSNAHRNLDTNTL